MKDLIPHKPGTPTRPALRKRLADASAAIRIGLKALIQSRGNGPLRMIPIYDRSEDRWLDQAGNQHVRYQDDWIGLAYYRDGHLVHEIRWDAGWPRLVEHKPSE